MRYRIHYDKVLLISEIVHISVKGIALKISIAVLPGLIVDRVDNRADTGKSVVLRDSVLKGILVFEKTRIVIYGCFIKRTVKRFGQLRTSACSDPYKEDQANNHDYDYRKQAGPLRF